MNACPQIGFTSFNSLVRDVVVGLLLLIVILGVTQIQDETVITTIINKLYPLSDHTKYDAVFYTGIIIITLLLSLLLGLLIDSFGHICTDFICEPTHRFYHKFFETAYNNEINVANKLVGEYIHIHNDELLQLIQHKNKRHNLELLWLFFANAPEHIINTKRDLWLYYEFYRNIGLVSLVCLYLIVSISIHDHDLKGVALFFWLISFVLIARSAKLIYSEIARIEVRFVIGYLLNKKRSKVCQKCIDTSTTNAN